ncbi:MAG: metal-dependent transcriptional regulator [Thermoproteales archaeon]|nr:metal-dependent transcriptional regulator [Thermoproteales archaeon]
MSNIGLTTREQEYLEAIYLLEKTKGFARIKDIAGVLEVKPPSVVEFLERLSEKKFVTYEKREQIKLTKKGKQVAKEIYHRHTALRDFLKNVLCIPEEVAEKDACYIEHGVHAKTIRNILLFQEFLEENPHVGNIIIEGFKKYLSKRLNEA